MTINRVRHVLYSVAKILGDINAAEKGRVPRRIARRFAGKITGRFLGWLFR